MSDDEEVMAGFRRDRENIVTTRLVGGPWMLLEGKRDERVGRKDAGRKDR